MSNLYQKQLQQQQQQQQQQAHQQIIQQPEQEEQQHVKQQEQLSSLEKKQEQQHYEQQQVQQQQTHIINKKRMIQPQWKDAVAGACAGAFSRTVMAPIERIKLVKQLQGSLLSSSSVSSVSSSTQSVSSVSSPTSVSPSTSSLSSYEIGRKIYLEQGMKSFWRGNVPNIIRVSGGAAINFTCMDYYKSLIQQMFVTNHSSNNNNQNHNNPHNNQQNQNNQQNHRKRQRREQFVTSFVSGGLAGATATTILYPIEFARTRLAMDMGTSSSTSTTTTTSSTSPRQHLQQGREFRNTRDVMMKMIQSDGIINGLYQGYGIALVGGIFYRLLLLGGYDAFKNEILFQKNKNQNVHHQNNNIQNHSGSQYPHNNNNTNNNSNLQKKEQQGQQELAVLLSPSSSPPPVAIVAALKLSMLERFLSAQCVSLIAGTCAYPFDSVRRRLMMEAGKPIHQRQYTSSVHCIRTIYITEGIKGFYLGIGPNLIRSFGGTLLLVGYDSVRTALT